MENRERTDINNLIGKKIYAIVINQRGHVEFIGARKQILFSVNQDSIFDKYEMYFNLDNCAEKDE